MTKTMMRFSCPYSRPMYLHTFTMCTTNSPDVQIQRLELIFWIYHDVHTSFTNSVDKYSLLQHDQRRHAYRGQILKICSSLKICTSGLQDAHHESVKVALAYMAKRSKRRNIGYFNVVINDHFEKF